MLEDDHPDEQGASEEEECLEEQSIASFGLTLRAEPIKNGAVSLPERGIVECLEVEEAEVAEDEEEQEGGPDDVEYAHQEREALCSHRGSPVSRVAIQDAHEAHFQEGLNEHSEEVVGAQFIVQESPDLVQTACLVVEEPEGENHEDVEADAQEEEANDSRARQEQLCCFDSSFLKALDVGVAIREVK